MVLAAFALILAPLAVYAEAGPGLSNQITDQKITSAIEKDMQTDSAISAHLVDVDTEIGIVTISGYVGNLLEKDRALEIAESTRGVRAVINKIQVRSSYRGDQKILNDVKMALDEDPATDGYEIAVSVSGGVVTLTGTVDSWVEEQLSMEVARGIRGVKDVKDNLTVDYKSSRPDQEIRVNVDGRLASDAWIDASSIQVSVDQGNIVLSGSVGSAAQKRRAVVEAWTSGARSVNYDRLNVDPLTGNTMKAPVSAKKTDSQIGQAVHDAFLYDPRVFSFNPDIEVTNGHVRLAGTVDNLKAKMAAEDDARNTRGVVEVSNELKVRPAILPDDLKLAVAVRGALLRDPYVERDSIDVNVVNAKVYLSGTVDSEFERVRAWEVVSRVNGVAAIENGLSVKPLFNAAIHRTDAQIKSGIESQFFWSVFVDGDDIHVDVKNGVAVLNGKVDSWAEKSAAVENAFEGGAKMVLNLLKIV